MHKKDEVGPDEEEQHEHSTFSCASMLETKHRVPKNSNASINPAYKVIERGVRWWQVRVRVKARVRGV